MDEEPILQILRSTERRLREAAKFSQDQGYGFLSLSMREMQGSATEAAAYTNIIAEALEKANLVLYQNAPTSVDFTCAVKDLGTRNGRAQCGILLSISFHDVEEAIEWYGWAVHVFLQVGFYDLPQVFVSESYVSAIRSRQTILF